MITKTVFFDAIWSKPLSQLSAELNIPSPTLRQICFDLNIPIPESYYWSRDNTINKNYQQPVIEDGNALFELAQAANIANAELRYPGESLRTFIVPNKLETPDSLITIAQKTIIQDYNLYKMPEMVRAGHGQIALRSSKHNLNRALRIMDTLIKCWRGRNYNIRIQDKETSVLIREVSFRVSLREVTKKLPKKDEFDIQLYQSTGRLAFKVDGHFDREWRDGKQPLEDFIKEIIDHMEVAARDLEKIWTRNRERRDREEEIQQRKEEQIRTAEEEKQAFESLVQEAHRWKQLKVLDEYLEELYRVKSHTPAFIEWYQWAKQRRKIFGPLTTDSHIKIHPKV